jgi:hypothetical protein
VIVLPRFWDRLSACAWFAVAPAGIEIIIAMEKPNAIITNNARILRLEMFLNALVTIPIQLAFHYCARRRPEQGSDFSRGVLLLPVPFAATCGFDFILFRFLASGRLSLGSAELLLNDFSELYQNLSLILKNTVGGIFS